MKKVDFKVYQNKENLFKNTSAYLSFNQNVMINKGNEPKNQRSFEKKDSAASTKINTFSKNSELMKSTNINRERLYKSEIFKMPEKKNVSILDSPTKPQKKNKTFKKEKKQFISDTDFNFTYQLRARKGNQG